jgi:prepilin-type N-terminal cleavage/methylation domain-containing protein
MLPPVLWESGARNLIAMKTPPPRTTLAFTLIELITVIAIISILMALLFPQIQGAMDSARRRKASTVVRGVVNACNNYKQDYGKYPAIAGAVDSTSTTNPYMSFGEPGAHCRANNNDLLDTLRAIDRGVNANHVLNPKQSKYYEGGKASDPKNPRDGFQDGSEFTDHTKQGQLMDPWGAQYCFILETDGDEMLDLSTFYSDLSNRDDYVHFAAVGISLGRDNQLGGKGYPNKLRKDHSTEAPDDIVSWLP